MSLCNRCDGDGIQENGYHSLDCPVVTGMKTPILDSVALGRNLAAGLKLEADIAARVIAGTGTKHDGDKPAMAYLPPHALTEVAKVMTFGAKKYGPFNYLGGISYTRLLSAAFRHGFAILRGEWLDPESGLPHYAHAGACFLMLGEMSVHRADMNDLFKPEGK